MALLLNAMLAIGLMALLFGLLLGLAATKFKVEEPPIIEQINNLLPQIQCGQCGYAGCKPYAEAIANGEAINKCPPGGAACVKALAELLGQEIPQTSEFIVDNTPKVAKIREEDCIGCTKCIQSCPVDAIIGSTRTMHTVLADECTGCSLCVAPCPTDCIEMHALQTTTQNWQWKLNSIPIQDVTQKEVTNEQV